MADWTAIVDRSSGRLISLGTIIAKELPGNLQKIALAKPPYSDNEMWDAADKAFIPRPPKIFKNRVDDDLFGHPSFQKFIDLMATLPNNDQNTIKNAVKRLLGNRLVRGESEPIEIGKEENDA